MITVRPVRSKKELKKFVLFPWSIYRNDPTWVPPLIRERLDFLDRRKNPFFEHAEGELFLAEADGRVVGRISAQIDRLHNERHQEKTGFFGLFESVDDPAVSGALLDESSRWLAARGMTKIRGPFSLSINEECGMLVKGFEHPPFALTGHNPPYYPPLLEGWGLEKIKDLFCWHYDSRKPIPEAPIAIAEEVSRHPGLTIRPIDPKRLERDVRIIQEIFNSAWSHNWGFVALTDSEIRKAVKDFRRILEPSMVLIAEINGQPAAICLCLPNINQHLADLNGRLFPLGLFKLLYRLKFRHPDGFRLVLLGIKKEYRGPVLGGLSVLLYVEIHKRGKLLGLKDCELSWTLEDNQKINAGIEFMGGEHYKTYRIYERELASPPLSHISGQNGLNTG